MSSTTKQPKLSKSNDPRYIQNPDSKRWVLKDSPTGRGIIRKMSKSEVVHHINLHAAREMIQYRSLLKSDMSDTELETVLKSLVDLNITESVARSALLPKKAGPKRIKKQQKPQEKQRGRGRPVGSVTTSRHRVQSPVNSKRPKKKRFVVKEPPETPYTSDNETTDFQTTTDNNDSDLDFEISD